MRFHFFFLSLSGLTDAFSAHTAYNRHAPSDKLNVTGLTPEEAVRQTEERLEQLLAPGQTAIATLEVTIEQSLKGRAVKKELLGALNECVLLLVL